jgi:hypothetical protein
MLNRNVVAQYSRDLSRDRHLDLFLQQSDAPRAVVEPEIHLAAAFNPSESVIWSDLAGVGGRFFSCPLPWSAE